MRASGIPTSVGIAIVEHRGRYLVGVRDADATLPGMAEFPGGKCQPDETPAACAIRETLEETGLRVSILEPFFECRHDYPHGSVALHFFLCRLDTDERHVGDQPGFEWVDAPRLSELDFPAANETVILKLLDRHAEYSSRRAEFG
jgi:mutator protein MutT